MKHKHYPDLATLNSFQLNYISNISEEMDRVEALSYSFHQLVALVNDLNEEQASYAYDTGKWTIKELVQHILDTERVFMYRVLAIARGETQNLLSFDENMFAANSNANKIVFSKILNDFKLHAQSIFSFLETVQEDALQTLGTANSVSINANTIVYLIAGHRMHHVKVLKERYGL